MGTLDDIYRMAAIYFGRHDEWPVELRLDAPRLHSLAREVALHDLNGSAFMSGYARAGQPAHR